MNMKLRLTIFLFAVSLLPLSVHASEEGTRHITGTGMNIYFMNDKVFGTSGGHPLWAIYNCGSDINGEIDVRGTYHKLALTYHRQSERIITGTFGSLEMELGKIEKTRSGFTYHVSVGEKEFRFSIRYQKLEDDHLVNSIIEAYLQNGEVIRLVVDGRLCPFATTGIIMIAAGAYALGA